MNRSDPGIFSLGGETVMIEAIEGGSGIASVVMKSREAYPQLARTEQEVIV